MQIKNAETKKLVFDFVTFEDGHDDKGAHVRRTQFPTKHYRGIKEIKNRLLDGLEVGVIETKDADGKDIPLETLKESDIVWMAQKDFKQEVGKRLVNERFDDSEVNFNDAMLAALKYCHSERHEMPEVSIEVLDEFEK